jgi:hypothetical protein
VMFSGRIVSVIISLQMRMGGGGRERGGLAYPCSREDGVAAQQKQCEPHIQWHSDCQASGLSALATMDRPTVASKMATRSNGARAIFSFEVFTAVTEERHLPGCGALWLYYKATFRRNELEITRTRCSQPATTFPSLVLFLLP